MKTTDFTQAIKKIDIWQALLLTGVFAVTSVASASICERIINPPDLEAAASQASSSRYVQERAALAQELAEERQLSDLQTARHDEPLANVAKGA